MAADEKVSYCQIDAHLDSNPKIRRAGRDGRDVFEFVLRRVAIARSEGIVPLKYIAPWYLADQLMCSEAEASNGVTRAVTAELICIDEHVGVVRVVGWSPEWGRRPKSNAERQADYRARNRTDSHAAVTDSNGELRDVTKITDQIRSEEIRSERAGARSLPSSGSEQGEISTARGAQAGSATRAHARQQPLPAAWQPTQAAADLARELGLDVNREASQFRRNAKAKGHTYADPDAAFELFLANSNDAGKRKPPKPGATTRSPRPTRTVVEGVELEDDGNGGLRPVSSTGTGDST